MTKRCAAKESTSTQSHKRRRLISAADRRDRLRNRQRILNAAGRLLSGTSARRPNMEAIAKKARLGVATVYRYFVDVEDVFDAYAIEVVTELRAFSLAQTSTGRELLLAVSGRWVELIRDHGKALVHMRSRQGFVERLRSGDRRLTVGKEALARPIRETLAELHLTAIDFDEALWLWNLFFDPREVLDVVRFVAPDGDDSVLRLLEAYLAALRAWLRPLER